MKTGVSLFHKKRARSDTHTLLTFVLRVNQGIPHSARIFVKISLKG